MNVIHTDGMVVAGKLPTERRLAELTGLGRLSLREALIAMEGMGILEIRNRQGIYVNEFRGEEQKQGAVIFAVLFYFYKELVSDRDRKSVV